MTIESHLNHVLESLFPNGVDSLITTNQLIESIDLTLLKEEATIEELNRIQDLAQHYPVAAVCLYLHHFQALRFAQNINFATVINFPTGNESVEASIALIDQAITLGIKEIDYVFPYQTYLAGNKSAALDHALTISQYCKQQGLTLKIILETGAFSELQTIYLLCMELLHFDCAFLKTSTGKINQGASLPAVFAILSAIQDSGKSCGIKISGGVKTWAQAKKYATLAEFMIHKKINKNWFRIGTSSLLEDLHSQAHCKPHY